MDFRALTEAIAEAEIITIYRHQRPDCDALGAQFGLKQWIDDNYPSKKVYALGFDKPIQGRFPASDHVSDDVIRDSLAIILDTSNAERVDDDRFTMARRTIKVDHHPPLSQYADINLVDHLAAATCEILAFCFQQTAGIVSLQTAEYLYMGLLTDTLCIKTSNTTANTLKAAAYLAGFSIDIPVINRMLFDHPYSWFAFDGCLHQLVRIKEGRMAYAIVTDDILQEFHLTPGEARNHVDLFGDIIDFEIWAMFTERIEDGISYYDGSVRSKTVTINEIMQKFGGGGHKNAAGVKGLSENQMYDLISCLFEKIPTV